MGKIIGFLYGLVCYLIFVTVLLYAIGFVGNLVVPKSIDSGPIGPFGISVLIDVLLCGLFAVQHSVMARPGFKARWTKIVPKSVERSTYVLISSLLLILLVWQWRPLAGEVWNFTGAGAVVLWALFGLGWATVLLATVNIGHFEPFGLTQVIRLLRGGEPPTIEFREPGLYKLVRHPIMLGFLIAFWAIPVMSVGHVLFAVLTTGYIMIGVMLEERDLVAMLGERYLDYKKRIPALIPFWPTGGGDRSD